MTPRSRASRSRTAAVFMGLALLACAKKGGGNDEDAAGGGEDAAVHPVVSVGTAVATLQTLSPTIRAIGTVSPSPGGYIELSAPGPARVARVDVSAGDAVRMGTPLLSFEGATLQATARSAAASLAAAQGAYDRAVRLSGMGIVPRKVVDQAAADLAQAKAAQVVAQRANELSTLRSPIAGVVTSVSAVQGEAVDASAVLVAVVDPAALDVVVSLAPGDAAKVRLGAAVTLRAEGTPEEDPGAPPLGTGVVAGIGAALDPATHTVPVRVRVRRVDRPLRMGESVTSDIAGDAVTRAVTVPPPALVPDGDHTIVFVVDHGVARAHRVDVGVRTGTAVQILSGVTAGQVVVTAGAFGVRDSSTVTVATP